MKVTFSGDFEEVKKGAEIFMEEAGWSAGQEGDLAVHVRKSGEKSLLVEKNGNDCVIEYSDKAFFFRGLSLLLYHAGEVSFKKKETILFDTNGCMLDCSRNAVLRVNKVKEIIRKMASLGLNRLMLYLEDTYEVEGHPYFGAYRGRYTKEELKECDDYADIFGIEVVPCIQTLAHLHNVLKWPEFSGLQDTGDVIMVGNSKTYALLKEMIEAASRPFRSKKIHLGMDEALQLGLGNYFNENGYQPAELIMKEHLEKVYVICEELNLEPMIWSDMYITSNTKCGYYETPENADTSNWIKPPEGLGLVYWDYYHHDEATFFNNLKVHQEIAKEVVFAGGGWTWNGVAPNLAKAADSSKVALKVCKELGIKNVFSTYWLDNGSETPVEAGYPIMTLFAEAGFGNDLTKENLGDSFRRCFGGSYCDFMLMNEFDHIDKRDAHNMREDTPSKYMLYQDVLIGMFDKQLEGYDIAEYYRDLNKKLKKALENARCYHDFFEYYITLSEVLVLKGDMGIRLKKAYDAHDLTVLKEIADEEIPECCKYVEELRKKRQKIWMADCKPFGYELLDIRNGSVAVRLSSAAGRIHDYLAGNIERIEELEEPRLLYRYREDGEEKGLCWESRWHRIISGCDLIDTI